jgi:deoxyribodipyrimidine photo-lyase
MAVPGLRIRTIHDRPPRADAAYVLYWSTSARRSSWNFALDRAVHWARELRQPLLVLEAIECDYPWASDRLHRFVVDGMRDNAASFARSGITYYPYVEPERGQGRGLLATLSAAASVVVTDDAPVFFLPAMLRAASSQVEARFEAVDGKGILPLNALPHGQVFTSAYAFRRYLQRVLPALLDGQPHPSPVQHGTLPGLESIANGILTRWPPATRAWLDGPRDLAALPIDHAVGPVEIAGGSEAGRSRLDNFITTDLNRYGEGRNHPDDNVSSGLSPYLHFGHLSAHEVVHRVLAHVNWTPGSLATTARGAREGWWGAPAPVEAFLDQLITWRELGFNMSARRPDVASFDALPSWAVVTLEKHASDRRSHVYTLEELTSAATHDELWNAAERQLLREGRIHNYLRMLWGKKILEWSATPREALEVMITLNDRYALDGRDPNSYNGIMWVLGRYDRPWAPERPIFGTVRYISSDNTLRKLRVKNYLRAYGPKKGVGTLF